ncbi:MAG: menaquinol-cytochrome C reductase [Chloroflexi bacterium]|nr:menaquinol-cytochrome C reductase [Chloroflexota bacterium]
MQLDIVGAQQEMASRQQKTHRLLAVVRKEVLAVIEKEPEDTAPTWPNLVVIEFLAVAIFSIGLFVISWLVNSPLGELANPDKTPNPSKAPWYFLNLQEMLLHMDAALAGVIVPGILIVFLMAIPYLDDVREERHRWFTSRQGLAISIFSALYTTAALVLMEIFDIVVGIKRLLAGLPRGADIAGWIVPILLTGGLIALLMAILRRRWQASRRDILIAVFTGFFVSYIFLTIMGTAFRGPGLEFFWPWEMPAHVE